MNKLCDNLKYFCDGIINSLNNFNTNGTDEGLVQAVWDLSFHKLLELVIGLHFDIERSRSTTLYCLIAFMLSVAGFLYYQAKHRPGEKENLGKAVIEVHQICGSLSPSSEKVKRCVMLLNEFPSLVNHPLPPYNYTPFLRACWSGNTVLVRYMLKQGADVRSRTVSRENAFYLAIYRVCKRTKWEPSILNLLLKAGCPLDVLNVKGISVLHLAARAGHVSLVRWLLAQNVHLHLPTTRITPYHLAIAVDDLNHRCVAQILHTHCPRMVQESSTNMKKTSTVPSSRRFSYEPEI